MATITKKQLIDRIAGRTNQRRLLVKEIIQQFLNEVIVELGKDNRLEFRDFGVFETKHRRARKAQNPKTLEPVQVPEKRSVKFKVGRLMKQQLGADPTEIDESEPAENDQDSMSAAGDEEKSTLEAEDDETSTFESEDGDDGAGQQVHRPAEPQAATPRPAKPRRSRGKED